MRQTTQTIPWEVGDALTVGGIRWKITALNAKTRAVQLEALSTTNHACAGPPPSRSSPGRPHDDHRTRCPKLGLFRSEVVQPSSLGDAWGIARSSQKHRDQWHRSRRCARNRK